MARKREAEEPLPIYTLDFETDPFQHKRIPQPFAAGLYDGKEFVCAWGKQVVRRILTALEFLPAGIVYVHNGGRFDFYYLIKEFGGELMIVNSRIIKARWRDFEFRDSFAIMPFPLRTYKKDDIEYWKLESDKRETYREEITSYLKGDCVYLWDLCDAFVKRFGDKLTIGSTALGELKHLHEFDKLNSFYDDKIREKFYFGGRVQCFQKGIIWQTAKIYDVNSMYPSVMRDYEHPISAPSSASKTITRETCFVIAEGINHGAFPVRSKNGIDFTQERGIYGTTIHEWNIAEHYGLFKPQRIINCVNFDRRTKFADFVDKFYHDRKLAKESGDEIHALFYKYVLNSAYGKFAQNPTNYFDYKLTSNNNPLSEEWKPAFFNGEYTIWKKPSITSMFSRHNVATACSITGAARSVLLEAIATSVKPLYCDTDSIICEKIGDVKIHDSELGAWKYEKEGNRTAIAGKKLYAVFNEGQKCSCEIDKKKCPYHIKLASKGAKLTPEQIAEVARGGTVIYKNDAPSFKWDGSAQFITRRIQMT